MGWQSGVVGAIRAKSESVRTTCKAYFTSYTEPRMRKVGTPKFDDLYKQQCLVNVQICVHEIVLSPIRNLIQLERNVSQFNLRLRSNEQNPLNIVAPITKSRISSQSFSAKGPAFWNALPSELKSVERTPIFKNMVKRRMLREYQSVSECHNPRCTDRRHHH